jgi:hypothetical protein
MAKRLLEVRGRIAVEQFWPEGESDTDTTKIHVGSSKDWRSRSALYPFAVSIIPA